MGVDGKERFWMAGRLGGGKKKKNLITELKFSPEGCSKRRNYAERTKRDSTERSTEEYLTNT